jgi:hypothetical protein
MLWNSRKIHGYALKADDGEIGTIADFLFDDNDWSIRWLVVDTGHWLMSRKVLLPTAALRYLDADEKLFSVRLTKKQVADSPNTDTDLPVSRQMESNIFEKYGWSPYWQPGFLTSGFGPMLEAATVSPFPAEQAFLDTENRDGDPHLRSVEQVTNYALRARDGEIGHVTDFLISDTDWSIRYMVVETGTWWSGKKILISPRSVSRVDWIATEISLEIDLAALKDSPDYTSDTVIDAGYERRIHEHSMISPP